MDNFLLSFNRYLYYMNKWSLCLKLCVVVLALLQPIIILIVCGPIHSISESWGTVLQPLFIFTNAVTSYFFFSAKKWQLPSLFLLGLTAFSVERFSTLHDILATLFFISCLYPMLAIKRYRYFTIFYLIGVLVGIIFGIFWGEVVGVYVISTYHMVMLLHFIKIKEFFKNRNSLKNN